MSDALVTGSALKAAVGLPLQGARGSRRGESWIGTVTKPLALTVPLAVALLMPRVARAEPVLSVPRLSEVVVTAERVHTSEQKTPVSMEVLSGSQLARKGVVDLQSLVESDSSANFITGNGAGSITMRGVSGSQGFGGPGIAAPSVPISFDGFFYNLNFIFNDALYDINRVEVLRGPQGTLFGRNSTGGLIHVVTNNPGRHFGGYGRLTLGSYNQVETEGALNVPINSKLQMRFAFFSTHHSGYHNTAFGYGRVDDQDARSGRIKVAYEPTAHLRFLLSFQMTNVGGAGQTDNIMVLPADANGFPTHVALPLAKLDGQTYNIAFPSSLSVNDKLTQWRMRYDNLPWGMTLTYLGGYDALEYTHNTPILGLDAAQYGLPLTIETPSFLNPATQNHELRIASNQHQAVTWQGGLYYWRSDIGSNLTHFRDLATPTAPDIVQFFYNDEQRSTAAYGQADWHLRSTIFSAGLRYTRDYVARTDLTSPQDGIFPALQSVQYSKWTWHVGEQWNVTNHHMLYAKVDTGYSAGGFNLIIPCNCTGGTPQPTTIQPYKPESVTTFEMGTKNKFLDDRMMLNADVFYSRYANQQLLESNQGGVNTVNAKQSNILGFEAGMAAVGRLGRFNLNATWLHARYDNQLFTNALNQTFNIGGNYLVQAPTLSVTASIEHVFSVGSGTLTPRIGTKFQTTQYYDFYNVPDSRQPAYTRTDVHLLYAPNVGRWSVDLFVRNVENAVVISDESESFAPPLSQPGTYNVGFQPPRTFGVTISDRF